MVRTRQLAAGFFGYLEVQDDGNLRIQQGIYVCPVAKRAIIRDIRLVFDNATSASYLKFTIYSGGNHIGWHYQTLGDGAFNAVVVCDVVLEAEQELWVLTDSAPASYVISGAELTLTGY